MDGQSTQPRKAQLDKKERENLEDVVTEMRYQLEEYEIKEKSDRDASLNDKDLIGSIKLEAVDGNNLTTAATSTLQVSGTQLSIGWLPSAV